MTNMKKYLLATVVALAMPATAAAGIIDNLGVDPQSSAGDFKSAIGGNS
jgi:hypothetical protein